MASDEEAARYVTYLCSCLSYGDCPDVELERFQSDEEVAQFAEALQEALHENESISSVAFSFRDIHVFRPRVSNWDPLLHELATREGKLQELEIWHTPTGHLRSLFRDAFFQVVQADTTNELTLNEIQFSSNNSNGFVSSLETASNLEELNFNKCTGNSAQSNIATALQRNTSIQCLALHECVGDFVIPIFQSLALPESQSRLKALLLGKMDFNRDEADGVASFLDSPSASQLTQLSFNQCTDNNEGKPTVSALQRHPHLQALILEDCPDDFITSIFQSSRTTTNAQPSLRSLRHLLLEQIQFTDQNSESIASFLGTTASLTELTLMDCRDDTERKLMATALQRNSTVEALDFERCSDEFIRTMVQGLASVSADNGTPSTTLTKISVSVSHFYSLPVLADIVQGLIHNTSVGEVSFSSCWLASNANDDEIFIEDEDENEQEGRASGDELARELAKLVQDKPNLSVLRLTMCDFCHYEPFTEALSEVLARREPPLRCLDISLDDHEKVLMSLTAFPNLMSAAAGSTRLEHLILTRLPFYAFGVLPLLEETVPLLKVKELSLMFIDQSDEDQEENLLEILKLNYTVQSVKCEIYGENSNWLSEANQARLEFYLDRNRKLAEWTANPKLVPRDLWTYALMLALKAGIHSLYQSLIALSGQGIGLKQKGRKRKHPTYYQP